MDEATRRMRLLSLFVLCGIAAIVWLLPIALKPSESPYLQVHFLDVGQGDSILIETPDGVQVLIDAGPDSTVLGRLSSEMGFFDRTIDMVVGTHPDLDHIGGLVDVFAQYDVSHVLTTENEGESNTASLYRTALKQEGATITYARRGQEFSLNASTTLRVLFPEASAENLESNTSSIVVQLHYEDTRFLFTGDAPKSIEEYLVLVEGEYLDSDVLKVGHHGSRTSTSELFLDEVSPGFAVISASKDNSYGHPHVEVTDLLFNKRVTTLLTAQEGTITLLSDGQKVFREE